MNDSEIIKALECCYKTFDCEVCPYNREDNKRIYLGSPECKGVSNKDVLDLIKRQQAEIDALKDTMAKLLNTLERANKYGLGADERIEQLKIELEKAKSEAVRKFAEKLKEYCNEIANQEWNKRTLPVSWADAYEDFIDDIDRLLEEMGCNDG